MQMLRHSPWGSVQHQKQMGDSPLIFVQTAGHGGIYVPPNLEAKMPRSFVEQGHRWAAPGWYEEDCCWALPVVALADRFTFEPCDLAAARETLLRCYPHVLNRHLPDPWERYPRHEED